MSEPRPFDDSQMRALIAKWRKTADIWERQDADEYADRPPERRPVAVKNWINWLRACANDAESALNAGMRPTNPPEAT